MTISNHHPASTTEQPFSLTAAKYNGDFDSGKIASSNFPYHKVQDQPGYSQRETPGLAAVDVTNELARHLIEYAERVGCPLLFQQRDISHYLWWQANRGMLAWEDILRVVRATRKRDRLQPIADYFGYYAMMEAKGAGKEKRLTKLVRYITQEGACSGCHVEYQFADLTLDRIKPGNAGGTYNLLNVQLMCQPCNNGKGSSYRR